MNNQMQYRKLPATGEDISLLGYGCMRFPRAGMGVDEARTERLVASAIDCGINYFDTAYIYQGSEKALGNVLVKLGARDRVKITTKLHVLLANSRRAMEEIFEKQLERLRTDHVDFYLAQALSTYSDFEGFIANGFDEFITAERARGRILHAGFSYHGNTRDFRRIVDAYPWDICTILYNYLDEHYQAGVEGAEYAIQKGLGVVVMEPLRGGLLGDGMPAAARKLFDTYVREGASVSAYARDGAAAAARESASAAPAGFTGRAPAATGSSDAATLAGSVPAATGSMPTPAAAETSTSALLCKTPAELALRWIWKHPGITCTISGMGTEQFLEENCRSMFAFSALTRAPAPVPTPELVSVSASVPVPIPAPAPASTPAPVPAPELESVPTPVPVPAPASVLASVSTPAPVSVPASAPITSDLDSDVAFSEVEYRVVEALREFFDANLRVKCSSCAYCMPCPYGVNIPACFYWYNMRGLTPKFQYLLATEGAVNNKPSRASLCKACGECEKRCPQKIEIIKCLKDVTRVMEKRWLRAPFKLAYRFLSNKKTKN